MTTPRTDELTHLTPQETQHMGAHHDDNHTENTHPEDGQVAPPSGAVHDGVTPRPRDPSGGPASEKGSDAGPAPEAGKKGGGPASLTDSLTERPQNGPEGWVPDFPGQRPPFAPGNTLAVTHGASRWRPDAYFRQDALNLLEEMEESNLVPGFLRAPEYRPAMLAYATTLVRIRMVEDWLARTAHDGVPEELDAEGEVRSATRLLERFQRSAARQRQELGLTPLSRARLGKDVAAGQTLAERLEEYRRAQAGGSGE